MMVQMQISRVAACVMALSAGAVAHAHQEGLPPPAVCDKGMAPVALVRQLTFPALESIPGSVRCAITYRDRYFGYLSDRQYSLKYKMRLQSTCYEAQKFEGLESIPLEFNAERREWVPNLDKRLKWAATAIGQEELDPAYKTLRREALRAYPLKSVNAQGFAFTEEEVIGDEKFRTRYLDYCLFHEKVALCGRGDVGYVAQGPDGDFTDYVLDILRSIEFLPSPDPVPAQAAASSGAAQGGASSLSP